MESYYGQIILFAGNFAPKGWAFCHGQLMSITENTALFSLLGTMYGGDGYRTFALPDLRGRVPVGLGQDQLIAGGFPGKVLGNNTQVEAGTDAQVNPTMGMNYIISLQGIFPSRV